ncbi:MAG: deoxyguanosinetriphosphate triphosphohydrolase family protein [Colwellia sp.]|nr:deoxyguanosinetriphosphate triphosphohydrolase family protein [Colwellia sp.]
MNKIWVERQQESVTKRQHDHRSPFQRDRARILHSAAFRRLQSKTQVMGSGQSDFYRTRLTHSLEASQIGSGILAQLRSKHSDLCKQLFPDDDTLIESLCLAHDIGHPPFGHGGEVALHYMMKDHGGFEGNGQTFRIVAHLEPFSEHAGMNLTRRSLLGLLKYPQVLEQLTNPQAVDIPQNHRQLKAGDWHPPKGVYSDDLAILTWVLAPLSDSDREKFQQIKINTNGHHKTLFKSLDCSVMELADDIAYGIHDLEDAIVTGIVTRNDFDDHVIKRLNKIDDAWLQEYSKTLTDKLFCQQHFKQKEAIGGLVNYLITAIVIIDGNEKYGYSFEEPLLKYNARLPENMAQALQIFKDFVYMFVIKQTSIQRIEYRGQQIVMELFEALSSDPLRLLPSNTAKRWQKAKDSQLNHHRVIADYVAGMTDEYATRLYQTLFSPTAGTSYQEPNF